MLAVAPSDRNVSLPPKLLGIVWNFWIVPLLPFVGLKSETLFFFKIYRLAGVLTQGNPVTKIS